MIERTLQSKIVDLARSYPVITLTGPRQSGKSTLLRHSFPHYTYVSLENPSMRLLAQNDPQGFLATYPDKVIIDEVQRVPSLFSYIQTRVDLENKEGMYLLAGSHNFLLMESVGQSLAGRTVILKLLPFSHREMLDGGVLKRPWEEEIFYGAYPRIFDKNLDPVIYYDSYLQTYVEKDVRSLKNIGDLNNFVRFVRLCAGRIGQLLNLSSLANECGISATTATQWLSILEASYICYRLEPDFNNYNKRIVKSPKLYFYDTGLACSLLNIHSAQQITNHYMKGELFENLVINEFIKNYFNRAQSADLTFWRDSTGNEVDLIDYKAADGRKAYEIKSSHTFSSLFFKNLSKWSALSSTPPDHCNVIYNGDDQLTTSQGNVVPWDILGSQPII